MFHVHSTNSLLANLREISIFYTCVSMFVGVFIVFKSIKHFFGVRGGGWRLTSKATLERVDRLKFPHFASKAKFMYASPTFVLV